jgi:hypothetical protein
VKTTGEAPAGFMKLMHGVISHYVLIPFYSPIEKEKAALSSTSQYRPWPDICTGALFMLKMFGK